MKKLLLIALSVFFMIACEQQKKRTLAKNAKNQEAMELANFSNEEYFLKEKNVFPEIIEIKAKQMFPDSFIFKPKEVRTILKDNYLIMKNLDGDNPFLLFSYPEMKYIESIGKYGNGPDEFISPDIIPTPDTTLLCYIFEATRDKLYKFTKDRKIIPYDFSLTPIKTDLGSKERNIVNIGEDDFIFVDKSSTGKSIFRTKRENDTIICQEITSLQLTPEQKSPFSYIGDFGINLEKKRMVYAYRYFKVIKFMDLEASVIKTLNFEQSEFNESTLTLADGLDQNITHYYGMSPQNEYVYLLYSGRTPIEAWKESQQGITYSYLEKYDWNGNPISKYKLDKFGYFNVEEKNNRLIIISNLFDEPFFEYNLLPEPGLTH